MTPSITFLAARFQAGEDLIPRACRYNHKAMWCDYRLRYLATAEPAERAALLVEIDRYTEMMIQFPRVAEFPPPLWRRPGEHSERYLVRCYDAAQSRYTSAAPTAAETAPFTPARKERHHA